MEHFKLFTAILTLVAFSIPETGAYDISHMNLEEIEGIEELSEDPLPPISNSSTNSTPPAPMVRGSKHSWKRNLWSEIGASAYNHHLGFKYLVSNRLSRSWHSAKGACEALGYSLASIEGWNEQHYVVESLIKRQSALRNLNDFWLSGTDQGHEGCWIWASPKMRRLHFTYWGQYEPNNAHSSEHCMTISKGAKYHWNDDDCRRTFAFVCKRSIRNAGPPPKYDYKHTHVC